MSVKIQLRIMAALWLGFTGLFVCGGKTIHVVRLLLPLTVAWLWLKPALRERAIAALRHRITTAVVMWFAGAVLFTQTAGLVLDYEGLHGTLWDLGQYISATRNMALTYLPQFHFHGSTTSNYFNVHSSLSVIVLGALYRAFRHPWLVLFWQGFFLTAPAFVALLWHRAAALKQGYRPEPLGYFLAFLTYAATPIFLGQEFWPFTFHVVGLTALALAYLFYYQRRWSAWLIALVLLTLEKEDFGTIASTFGALVFFEALLKRSSDRKRALALAAAAMFGGVAFFVFYSANFARSVPFSGKFGHLAQTPTELIAAFFTRPMAIMQALARPLSVKYVWFFLAASFLWLKPRWSALRFFVPVAPLLLLNAIAVEGTMQLFKDHYALPLAVGLSATLVLGVWDTSVRKLRAPNYALFALTALFPLLWNHQTTFRHFKDAAELWRGRAPDRAALAAVKKDERLVVCCQDRLCTWLIDRPLALDYSACLRGSVQLDSYVGRKAVFVTNAASGDLQNANEKPLHAFVPAPNKWVAVTPFLRLSEPVSIERQPK